MHVEDDESGGSWKIAYADFTTAMMALFIVLWLTSITSEDQRDLLAEFFNPVSVSRSHSGSDGVLDGRSIDTDGGMKAARENRSQAQVSESGQERTLKQLEPLPGDAPSSKELAEGLQEKLEADPALSGLLQQIELDPAEDGLAVTISDSSVVSMFKVGSADLTAEAFQLIQTIGRSFAEVPGLIHVEGHTDGRTYPEKARYTNWELSSDRANAARRALALAGVPGQRILRIQGYADKQLRNPDQPLDASNRRVVIRVDLPQRPRKRSLLPD